MQININVCKKFSVSYVAQTGSLTVDFESDSTNALATLLSGGNFRARFFLRRMFDAKLPNEPQAAAEQRGAQKAQEYSQQLTPLLKDGVRIAHGVFTISELSNGTMNAVSVPRNDGTRVVMTALTRDVIVNQDEVDETLQATLLNEMRSLFNQGIANGRYQAAQAVYQPTVVGASTAQPQQQAVNPLAGLQAAAPEQSPAAQTAPVQQVQQAAQQPVQQPMQSPAF